MSTYNGHVKATRVATSTLAVSGRFSLLGVQYSHAATGGVLNIIDGLTSSGTTVAVLNMHLAAGSGYVQFPGQGIRMETGIYVDLGTGGLAATVFYG